MTELLEWVKKMIYLSVFLTLILHILPEGSYRKYVRFFAGLIFIVTVMAPMVQLVHRGSLEEAILSEISREKEREVELDFSYMEEIQQEKIKELIEAEQSQEER
ncbi:MAG: stage III sporulation protein AF [Eubacterium sp.]